MAQHTFLVGEKKKISLGGLRFTTVVYCGMPSANSFSIMYKEKHVYQGYAMNLFYPTNIERISIKNTQFQVISVTSKELVLEIY